MSKNQERYIIVISRFCKKIESFGAKPQKSWPKNKVEMKVGQNATNNTGVSCNHPIIKGIKNE